MGRSPCCEKNSGLKKGPWTTEEDEKLTSYIHLHGPGNWRNLPKNAGLQRCGKSCRLRWTNYLRPDIRRGRFSFEEEESIIQLHSILGNKWSAIAARLPGRTDNEIKNYWNTHIRKRLLRNGIDPVTHTPRLDLLDFSTLLGSALYNANPAASLLSLLAAGQTHQPLLNPELLRLAVALGQQQQVAPVMNHAEQTTSSQQQLENVYGFQELNNNNNTGSIGSHVQENLAAVPSDFGFWNTVPELSENYFQSASENSNGGGNVGNVGSSVMSTPLSSPARLTTSSAVVNGGSWNADTTTYQEESDQSSLFKFEIPEILESFDNFM